MIVLLVAHILGGDVSAQCECAGVVAFFHCLFLCPNFESVPNVNELMLAHFLGGDFCAHILRVHPM